MTKLDLINNSASDGTGMERRFSGERLSRLGQLERWHFWFVARRALVDRLLGRYGNGRAQLILDVGCGTGLMLSNLMRQGHQTCGLDRRPEGLRATHRSLPQSWLLQGEASCLQLKDNSFDGVLILDVLEHVDDGALLAEVSRVLRPGGWALITVPAMPWLWSFRDEAAGHFRRYTRRQLFQTMAGAQLQVKEMRYYQFWLFPLVALARWLGRRGPRLRDLEEQPPTLLNAALIWLNRFEVALSDVIPWPWGSSLAAIGRKP